MAKTGKKSRKKRSIVQDSYSESFKGQQYMFVEPVPDDLMCPVCHELLDRPQQTTCGHLFCKKCLEQSNSSHEENWKCPQCRTVFDSGGFDDKYLDRKVKNLMIYCPNALCEWKGSLLNLSNHKVGKECKGCQYEPVLCTLGCGEKFIRKSLEDHKKGGCLMRTVVCEHCQWKGSFRDSSCHFSSCQKYPIPCPNLCGLDGFPVEEMKNHLQKCPKQEIKCPYNNMGCTAVFKRHELESHKEDSKDHHLHLALDRVSLLTQVVMESSLNTAGQLSLAHCPWLENTELFPSMPWIIRMDGFSKKGAFCSKWTSEPFFSAPTGYKFCLEIFADGGVEDYVSVFLYLHHGPSDSILSWPFDKNVNIILLNQLEDNFHHCKTLKSGSFNNIRSSSTASTVAAVSGYGKFISQSELDRKQCENCQYLKGNCLFFKVELP